MPVLSLADHYWSYLMEIAPSWATLLGIHDHDAMLEDLSSDAEQAHRKQFAAMLSQALDLHPAGQAERITADMIAAELDARLRSIGGSDGDSPSHAVLASEQMRGPHMLLLRATASMTFPAPAHASASLDRFRQFDRYLQQAADRFREGLELGLTPVARNLRHVVTQIDGYLASPIDSDPLLAMTGPADWDGEAGWRVALSEITRDVVRPAMQRYRDVFAHELLPHGRDDAHAGMSWLDGGDAIYRDMAHIHTSLAIDPDEVHSTGADYIDGPLSAEFADVGQRVFGITDLAAIFDRMRTDVDLRYVSGEQMISDATDALNRARDVIDQWFGRLPVAACTVTSVPPFLAVSAPPAYYLPPAQDGTRGGTYFLNTHNASSMFRFEGQATAFHEAIPGHHLQLAIAGELDGVPAFQQHALQTAYAEGWGLYAERLADEMQLYASERDRLGMLALDAFRAARLVVDTGLHAKGWSRGQAVDYMRRHTPLPFDTIDVEVDRYIAIPGQALSYKLGQLEIRRLRTEAEAALGSRFDIRGFHDVVLGSGMVTLGVLATLVGQWVDRRRATS